MWNATCQLTDINPLNSLNDVFQLVCEELDNAVELRQMRTRQRFLIPFVVRGGLSRGRWVGLWGRVHLHSERSVAANALALPAECGGLFPHRADELQMTGRSQEIGWEP